MYGFQASGYSGLVVEHCSGGLLAVVRGHWSVERRIAESAHLVRVCFLIFPPPMPVNRLHDPQPVGC